MRKLRTFFISAVTGVSLGLAFLVITTDERRAHFWKEAVTAVMVAALADRSKNCDAYFEAVAVYRANARLMGIWDKNSQEKVEGGDNSNCPLSGKISTTRR